MPAWGWWMGALSMVCWGTWLLWPARFVVLAYVGARYRKLRLQAHMLGVRFVLEASMPGAGNGARPPILHVRLRIRLLRVLRLEKAFPLQIDAGEGDLVLWLQETWRAWLAAPGKGRWPLVQSRRDEAPARVSGVWRRIALWQRAFRPSGGMLRRHVRIDGASLELAVGTGDAALTGWLAGVLWSSWGAALVKGQHAFNFKTAPVFRLRPVFHRRCFSARFVARATLTQGWMALQGTLATVRYAVQWLKAKVAEHRRRARPHQSARAAADGSRA